MTQRPSILIRFWPWGFILMVIALAALAAVARPLYQTARAWRASTYLAEAQEAFEAEDLVRASQRAKLCLQFKPGDTDAARVLAQIADKRNVPESLNLWSFVVQSSHARDSDHISLAEASLREGLAMVAQQQLDLLLTRPQPSKETYHLAGLLAFRQGQPALARSWFQKALDLDAGYARANVNLARVELLVPKDAAAREAAINRLMELGQRQDQWGLQSLVILVRWALEQPGEANLDQSTGGKLAGHPKATMAEKCLATQWEVQRNPLLGDELIARLTARTDDLSPQDKRELASWLYRMGLREKLLQIFPLDPREPEPLLLVQMDALASLGRWKELDKFLENDLVLESPVLLWIFRARAARELGSESRYELCWRQAARAAGREPLALRYLAYYAEMLGDLPRAVDAYEALSQLPQFELEALLKMIRPYEKLGQTQKLLTTLKRLSFLQPDDPVINNDVAYLGLLLDDSSVRPHERARQVYEADSRMPAYAATYALSELKSGHPAEAVEILRNFPLKQLTAPGWQAIYAAALHATGERDNALTIARRIDERNLKPEEAKLLESFWNSGDSR